jgi:3-keto-5-aminohexanoate cleavage enzyme
LTRAPATGNDHAMDPVIIEVAVNGVTRKERNPTVPVQPDEVAADTIRCLDAGATVVHTHPHGFGDGSSPDVVAERYASAYRTIIAERPDAILYPTMSGGPTIADRWDHHRALAAEGLIRCGCLDPGSTNLASFGADGLPTPTDFVYTNSPNDVRFMMAGCTELGIGPSFAIYEPAFLRMVLGFHAGGHLAPGALVKFYFSGNTGYLAPGLPTFSAPPIPEALALYRAMLGDVDLPWAVTVLGGDILETPVARLALEQGGHIRVGIEDYADAESNVVCVERAVELATNAGRAIATRAEAAQLLRLPARVTS